MTRLLDCPSLRWCLGVLGLHLAVSAPAAQVGTVASEQKISETTGGFGGTLDPNDLFGVSVAWLGDLDGDGNRDLAVGALQDDDGAVWILFLNADGTVASEQKISETTGGFGGVIEATEGFALSIATLGDLDGDGNPDLAVGVWGDDDGGADQGAVWILFLNADGTVASEQKISETTGGFGGVLHPNDGFGMSVASVGDLDGDGNPDLAVGAPGDDDGGALVGQGAVWILFMNADGTVASEQKISETSGGFGGVLDELDYFGISVGSLGDLDGDGNLDLAVGAVRDDDGGADQGAVWILFLNADGTVASEQKISETTGGFGGVLHTNDGFGISVGSLRDLDGDGNRDLAVGAHEDSAGAVWILFMNADGTVASEQKISATTGGFGGVLDAADVFGRSVASPGDLDGDGSPDLAVGAEGDDDGGSGQGAVWILFLNGPCNELASVTKVNDAGGLNAQDALNAAPGSLPTLGNAAFKMQIDDPAAACAILPGSPAFVALSPATASFLLPHAGCAPGAPGEIMIDVLSSFVALKPGVWSGPGSPTSHTVPIPYDATLCGTVIFAQGLWLTGSGAGSYVLTNRLDLKIGL